MDGKTVRFSLPTRSASVVGHGVFRIYGTTALVPMKIDIAVADAENMRTITYHLSQAEADRITQSREPEIDFILG